MIRRRTITFVKSLSEVIKKTGCTTSEKIEDLEDIVWKFLRARHLSEDEIAMVFDVLHFRSTTVTSEDSSDTVTGLNYISLFMEDEEKEHAQENRTGDHYRHDPSEEKELPF